MTDSSQSQSDSGLSLLAKTALQSLATRLSSLFSTCPNFIDETEYRRTSWVKDWHSSVTASNRAEMDRATEVRSSAREAGLHHLRRTALGLFPRSVVPDQVEDADIKTKLWLIDQLSQAKYNTRLSASFRSYGLKSTSVRIKRAIDSASESKSTQAAEWHTLQPWQKDERIAKFKSGRGSTGPGSRETSEEEVDEPDETVPLLAP